MVYCNITAIVVAITKLKYLKKENKYYRNMQSLVVFTLNCETCNQKYKSKTERILLHKTLL
jgi:hypothetical protein